MKKLILASASPRRKEILSLLNIPFDIIPADINEDNLSTLEDITRLAYEKAKVILNLHPDAVVIGADTVVASNNQFLGKPLNLNEAKKMITLLSNNIHSVYTGVCILSKEQTKIDLIQTKVFVNPISPTEIDEYIQNESIMDAAGAYKIQGSFSKFIQKIEGDYLNIVGLPLNWVYEHLKFF